MSDYHKAMDALYDNDGENGVLELRVTRFHRVVRIQFGCKLDMEQVMSYWAAAAFPSDSMERSLATL